MLLGCSLLLWFLLSIDFSFAYNITTFFTNYVFQGFYIFQNHMQSNIPHFGYIYFEYMLFYTFYICDISLLINYYILLFDEV